MTRNVHHILSGEEAIEHSEKFADQIPEDTFSLAQVQCSLLTKKVNARRTTENIVDCVQEQLRERQKIQDLKEKKRRRKEKRERERKERETREESEIDVETSRKDVNETNGDNDEGSAMLDIGKIEHS